METYENIVKRFKFDLEMGRFGKSSYCLLLYDHPNESKVLFEILDTLGFHVHKYSVSFEVAKEENLLIVYNAVLIEGNSKLYTLCYVKDTNSSVTKVPDYIKEYAANAK